MNTKSRTVKKPNLTCNFCGTRFYREPSSINRGSRFYYCGQDCYHESNRKTGLDKFWEKVDKNGPIPERCPELGPCWQWTASCRKGGYGQLVFGKISKTAHIYSWEIHVGPVDVGLFLDHLCSNRRCVNPTHLEPVTPRVNIARSAHCLKSHCINGHEWNTDNIRIGSNNKSYCLPCCREKQRRYKLQKLVDQFDAEFKEGQDALH